jgi:hypothetical protein
MVFAMSAHSELLHEAGTQLSGSHVVQACLDAKRSKRASDAHPEVKDIWMSPREHLILSEL